jgi:hypothetical protein
MRDMKVCQHLVCMYLCSSTHISMAVRQLSGDTSRCCGFVELQLTSKV